MKATADITSGQHPYAFLAGGGEMGKRIRSFPWAETPVGPVDHWPQSLKTAVRIMLTSRQPIWIGWGQELIYFYNDAYQSIIGGKHPWALGQPASAVWREIWDDIGPMLSTAMSGDEGTYVEAQLLIMERNGYPEETYYTFSYSPIPDDAGGAGGIICANTDDTQRVIGERQVALLRELAADTADARTLQEACDRSARALSTNSRDVPFAMIYMADPDGRHLSLAGTAGIRRGHPAASQRVALDHPSIWPFADALRNNSATLVPDLESAFETGLPLGTWRRPPAQAAILPIHASGEAGKAGVLVVGLSPFRLFDDSYQGFLGLVAGQIAAGIANAQAYELEKKRAEALAELDRAKTAFFSNISHEFRTPLTLMLGPVEDMLTRSYTDLSPAAKGQLEVVNRNGLRLLRLVNTLLDFSRIEAGRVRAVYQPTDLAAFTADLASVFRAAVERAGLQLVIDCHSLSQPVYLDRDMWEKVVLNLLSNAFKFTFEGEIAVTLEEVGETAVLRVRDTGTGVPAEEMPRLFERFHRIENARGRTHEGSGIGLALVQELVKLHGGAVTAESVFGQGTTFTVALPLGSAHLPPQQLGESRTAAPAFTGAAPYVEEALRWLPVEGDTGTDLAPELPTYAESLRTPYRPTGTQEDDDRPRVLVADDNADMRQYVARVLSEHYRIETVADGEAALAAARERAPDLVLTDIMMPRLDGFGLLRELRAHPATSGVPVLLLSARAGEESRVEGMESGADDYLVKPFSARELVARVTAHLQMARMRREASDTLRESEERYRLATRASHDVVWDWNMVSDEVVWSEALHSVFGYPPEQAGTVIHDAFQWWTGHIHPDDRTRVGESFQRTADAGQAEWVEEYRFLRADGTYAEVADAAFIVFDQDSKPIRIVGAMTDVTARKQTEEALRKSEARFRAIVNQTTVGIAQTDLTGRFVLVNSRYCEILGYSREELLQRRMQDLTHPDDLPRNLELFRRLTGDGTPFIVEKRYLRKDGSAVWVQNTVSSIKGEDGQPQLVVAVTLDVTERKQAEKALRESENRFRTFADTAPAMLWITDSDASCSFLSRGWYEYTGQTEAYALGFGWMDAIHPDDRATSSKIFLAANARHEPFAFDYRLRRADGDYRWAVDAGRPRFGSQGEFLGYIGSVIDIDDRKKAEEQLRQAAKMEAIGRLAGGIAHDFNNQLHGVSGFANFVAQDPGLGARARQDLEEVQKATERMAGLTRQLLAFSRQQVLQPETLDLNAAVTDGQSLLHRLIGSAVEMELDLDEGTLWVRADRAQLLQVLMNLTINARDAMPSGGRLLLRTRRREVTRPHPGQVVPTGEFQPGVYAELTVTDTGTGIAPENFPHIFEPFFTTKEVGQGTGLGLATVHGIVNQSQGYVWAESSAGSGTSFTVLLPAAAEPESDGSHRDAAPVAGSGRPARVLVVDDEEMVRLIVARTLEAEGYQVFQARNGSEALERLANAPGTVDLVLSDVVMPVLGGRGFGERLTAEYPGVAVMWMSGYPRDSAFGGNKAAEAQPFLQKPIPSDVLISTVRDILARREAVGR